MKRRSNWRTALLTRRVRVGLICAAACSLATATLLAFLRPQFAFALQLLRMAVLCLCQALLLLRESG